MRKLRIINLFIGILLIISSFGCQEEQITDGYLSKDVRYETNPFVIRQGEIKASPPLAGYGSTAPLKVELLDIRKVGSEETAEAWMETFPTPVWTGSYDPKVDTTLAAIVENKIKIEEFPVLRLEEIGGRLMISSQTWNIEPGEYVIDVKVTNTAGSRIIKEATKIILQPGIDYLLGYKEAFFTEAFAPQGWVWRPLEVEINHDPSGPNRLILKWVDRNGEFFNPNEGEVVNGHTEGWRHHFQENTPWGYEITDDSMIFEYPFPPFPSNPQAWVYSYRIPAQYIGAYSEEVFAGMDYNTRLHNIRLYREGTYTFTIMCSDIERFDPN